MKQFLTSVCGGTVLLALLAGCDPSMAQIQSGSLEEQWYKQLKDNYSSFTLPQYPAPAVYGRGPRTAPAAAPAGPLVAPSDDPEKFVDQAAAKEAAPAPIKQEAQKETVAPAEEPKPAVPADADARKAGDVKAEKKETAAKDAKADEAAAPQTEKFHIVKSGDTLGGIAQKYYGRASMDDVIYKANAKVIKNRNFLSIGMRLVIPEL